MLKMFFFVLGCAVLASGPLSYKPDYKAIVEAKRAHHITINYAGAITINKQTTDR